jgi:hypothetical protein
MLSAELNQTYRPSKEGVVSVKHDELRSLRGAALRRIATLDDPAGIGEAISSSPVRNLSDCPGRWA